MVLYRGIPTTGSWPGVGGGNYSYTGVGEKCLNCAKKKKIVVWKLLHKKDLKTISALGEF